MKANHVRIMTTLAAVLLGTGGVEAHELYARHSAEVYEKMAAEVGKAVRECNDTVPNGYDLGTITFGYTINAVRADQKYESKVCRGYGYVRLIEKDSNGAIHVTVVTWESGHEQDPERAIICYFAKSEEESVAKLKPSDRVLIRGECIGNASGWVILLGCHIDEVESYRP